MPLQSSWVHLVTSTTYSSGHTTDFFFIINGYVFDAKFESHLNIYLLELREAKSQSQSIVSNIWVLTSFPYIRFQKCSRINPLNRKIWRAVFGNPYLQLCKSGCCKFTSQTYRSWHMIPYNILCNKNHNIHHSRIAQSVWTCHCLNDSTITFISPRLSSLLESEPWLIGNQDESWFSTCIRESWTKPVFQDLELVLGKD